MSRTARAYLNGVIHGDGWLAKSFGLRSIDRDFTESFSIAITAAFGNVASARKDERGYWLVRLENHRGQFNTLRNFSPASNLEKAVWLRGLFDSEGNAQLTPVKNKPNSVFRNVEFFSTNTATLCKAADFLASLGIGSRAYKMKSSAGHKGTKQVWRLVIQNSCDHFGKFSDLIGSNIRRKAARLAGIAASYCTDLPAALRAAQLKGAATKRRRRESTLPIVLSGIRKLIADGKKPTIVECERAIAGYASFRTDYFPHTKLLALASQTTKGD